MDETFSSIDLVTQCLTDLKRTSKFQKAIEEAVKSGDTVLDLGTGSGVLALFAARAGAKKVIAVEFDPYVADLARTNVKNNGYEDVVDVVLGDARKIAFDSETKFDVVIMEMLTTGMVDEYQVWAANNLHQREYVKKSTIFVPARQDTYVSVMHTDFKNYGLMMRMVKHQWEGFPEEKSTILSNEPVLNSVSFDKVNGTLFKERITFEIKKSGVMNSIYLRSVTVLNDHMSVKDTLSLNAPVILPLSEDTPVKKGEKVSLEIEYIFGNGYRNFKVKRI